VTFEGCFWCGKDALIWVTVPVSKGTPAGICFVCWQENSSDGGAAKYIEGLEAFETYVDGLSS
jgi:hypothetical protein